MSNPNVTATISVDDKASPALKELANLAKMIAKETAAAMNGGKGDGLAASYKSATVAAKEHLSVLEKIHKVHSAIAGTIAGAVGAKAFGVAQGAFTNYIPYERDVRYQQAIQHYSASDMSLLERQRVNAANVYGLKPEDTLHAQQAFVTRGFNAAITEAATTQAIILSKALNVSVEDASKLVEGIAFAQGVHLKDPASATAELKKDADRAAVAAKRGAMSPEDIQKLAEYGMSPGTAVGLTPEQVFATGMTFKRANIDGTQAGTFIRNAASHLIAPTTMGRDALSIMLAREGKTLNDFTGGASLTPEAIDAALAQNGNGRRLGAKGIASLRASIEDGLESGDTEKDVVGNRAAFNAAARKALEESGQKFDKGEIPKIVAHMQRLRDISLERIKVAELYDYVLHHGTQQEKNAVFGPKQGGRAASLNSDTYDENLKAQQEATGFAAGVAEERMKGLAAAVDRLNASIDTAEKQMVAANTGWLTPLVDAAGKLAARFTGLSTDTKESLSLGALTASAAGIASMGAVALRAAAGMGSLAVGVEGVAGVLAVASLASGGAAILAFVAAATVATNALYGLVNSNPDTRLRQPGEPHMTALQRRKARLLFDPGLNDLGPNGHLGGTTGEYLDDMGVMPATPYYAKGGNMWRSTGQIALGQAGEGDAKWGDPSKPTSNAELKSTVKEYTEVKGTVAGEAELHANIAVTVEASQWFKSAMARVEALSKIPMSGRLGESMTGGGGNSVKPSVPMGPYPDYNPMAGP